MLILKPSELPVINGEKLSLRPITDADTPDIVRWRNDPEVWRYFLFREPFTPETLEKMKSFLCAERADMLLSLRRYER